jgi:aminoglycoside 6'-N-acetyltransferase I
MEFRSCTSEDVDDWAVMRAALHPDGSIAEHREDVLQELAKHSPDYLALICCAEDGASVAFAEAKIRHDYVEDCETSPVPFLEDIYVAPEYRRRGVASALVAAIADWGRSKGCTEFASNILIDNMQSHAFHLSAGFQETSRTINFRQPL